MLMGQECCSWQYGWGAHPTVHSRKRQGEACYARLSPSKTLLSSRNLPLNISLMDAGDLAVSPSMAVPAEGQQERAEGKATSQVMKGSVITLGSQLWVLPGQKGSCCSAAWDS